MDDTNKFLIRSLSVFPNKKLDSLKLTTSIRKTLSNHALEISKYIK